MKDAVGGRAVGVLVGQPSGKLSVTNIFPRTSFGLWLSVKRSVPSWNSLRIV